MKNDKNSMYASIEHMARNPYKKGYDQPLAEDWIIAVGDYLMAFVIEETIFGPQKSLSISRVDGKDFTRDSLVEDIPRLFEFFPNFKAVFPRHSKNRGFMLIFIGEREGTWK